MRKGWSTRSDPRFRDGAACCFNLGSAAKSSGINATALLAAAGVLECNIVSAALRNSLNFKRLRNTTGTDSVCSGFVFPILVSEPVGAANADAQTT
jgi:hypothetical protein